MLNHMNWIMAHNQSRRYWSYCLKILSHCSAPLSLSSAEFGHHKNTVVQWDFWIGQDISVKRQFLCFHFVISHLISTKWHFIFWTFRQTVSRKICFVNTGESFLCPTDIWSNWILHVTRLTVRTKLKETKETNLFETNLPTNTLTVTPLASVTNSREDLILNMGWWMPVWVQTEWSFKLIPHFHAWHVTGVCRSVNIRIMPLMSNTRTCSSLCKYINYLFEPVCRIKLMKII